MGAVVFTILAPQYNYFQTRAIGTIKRINKQKPVKENKQVQHQSSRESSAENKERCGRRTPRRQRVLRALSSELSNDLAACGAARRGGELPAAPLAAHALALGHYNKGRRRTRCALGGTGTGTGTDERSTSRVVKSTLHSSTSLMGTIRDGKRARDY